MTCYIIRYHAQHDKPWKVWDGNRVIKEFKNLWEAEQYLDYIGEQNVTV